MASSHFEDIEMTNCKVLTDQCILWSLYN